MSAIILAILVSFGFTLTIKEIVNEKNRKSHRNIRLCR